MKQGAPFAQSRLTTPRGAASESMVYFILMIISLVLIRISVSGDPREAGAWLPSNWKTVNLAPHLLPFAGIAFLFLLPCFRAAGFCFLSCPSPVRRWPEAS